MNKVWLLLVLVLVIAAQWTFLSSFYSGSTHASAFGTSAVIVAKENSISLRAKFVIRAEPGHKALVLFPDGSQEEVISGYEFEVFLPKTGSFLGNFFFGNVSSSPEAFSLTDKKPMSLAVVSNVTEDFFSYGVGPDSSGRVSFYWFKIQGNAEVIADGYGVAV